MPMITINVCDDDKFRVSIFHPGGAGKGTKVIAGPFDTRPEANRAATEAKRPGDRISPHLGSMSGFRVKAPAAQPRRARAAAIPDYSELAQGKATEVTTLAKTLEGQPAKLRALLVAEEAAHPPKSATDAAGRKSVVKVIRKLLG